MDEEPGAVINRLLEDGDVQIIDPPPPPPPLSANVVRHPVQQTLHNFESETLADLLHNLPGLINNQEYEIQPLYFLSPGFLVQPLDFLFLVFLQEIRNPAPGFLISCVFGPAENPGNKKSGPWISYFLIFWSKSLSSLQPSTHCLRANSETLADLLQES